MSDEILQHEMQAKINLKDDHDQQQCTLPGQKPPPQIALFVKAGSDRECLGCCPFSQRLFMILWLKGVVFQVTTCDKATKPKEVTKIAPGATPPFLMFNTELLTDISKCEDYIEAELYPPNYPKLACKYPASRTAGNDIFAKFSAFIKYTGDRRSDEAKKLQTRLIESLRKFNKYLEEPLDHEIDADSEDDKPQKSTRRFIDGDFMTLADCNMLPKLNILQHSCKWKTGFEIPAEFEGIHRYLCAAKETEEFKQTCADQAEVVWTYGGPKPKLHRA